MGIRPKLPRTHTPWWIPTDQRLSGPKRSFAFEYDTPKDALTDLANGYDQREGMTLHPDFDSTYGERPDYTFTASHEALVSDEVYDQEIDVPDSTLPVFIEPPTFTTNTHRTNNIGAALEWMRKS